MTARRIIWAIIRRDLRILAGNKTTAIPMVALPVLFFLGLPLLVGISPRLLNLPLDDMGPLLSSLPEALIAQLPSDPEAQLAVVLLVYLLAPLFLVVPLMLSVVAAAGAIAGERERGTLETLLLSPVSDRQLFVAKTAGAWLPAVAITLLGSLAYQATATWALASHDVRPFPNLVWTLLVLWVSPALAAAALGAVVTISARSRTFQDALQLSGMLVLPLIGLMVAQASGLVFLGPVTVGVAGAVLWLLAALLLSLGARSLRRDDLMARA